MPDNSNRDLKKFMVALVLSGTFEATGESEALEKIDYALELFDFIEDLQSTIKIVRSK